MNKYMYIVIRIKNIVFHSIDFHDCVLHSTETDILMNEF